jgi:hypothetical protein
MAEGDQLPLPPSVASFVMDHPSSILVDVICWYMLYTYRAGVKVRGREREH